MAYLGNTVQTQGFIPAIDYFNGNGSTVTFTLSRSVASVAQMIVAIDNVIQNPSSAYTVSGNSITFTSAPLSGTNNIWVEYTSLITQVIQPGQGTVGQTQMSNPTGTGNPVLATQPIFTNVISVGGTAATNGSGIAFPATQSASTNPNTLDDYEEGTWTPTGIGQTFASASGKYTKIGRVVYISFDLVWSVTGAGNQAGFSGFPFASDGSVFAYTRGTSSYSGSIVMTSPGYAGTTSGVLLYNFGNAPILDSTMSGLTLAGSGFYFTS